MSYICLAVLIPFTWLPCTETAGFVAIGEEDLVLTSRKYPETVDPHDACVAEFGPNAKVMDWMDLKELGTQASNIIINNLGIKPGHECQYVDYDGKTHSVDNHRYLFVRHRGDPPSGWVVHDILGDITLGNGYGPFQPFECLVLCSLQREAPIQAFAWNFSSGMLGWTVTGGGPDYTYANGHTHGGFDGMLASPWNRRDYVHSPVSVLSPRVCNVSRVTFSIGGGTSSTTNFTQTSSYLGVLLVDETGTVVKQQECEHDDERFVHYEWTGLSGCYHMELRDGKAGAWGHIQLNSVNFYGVEAAPIQSFAWSINSGMLGWTVTGGDADYTYANGHGHGGFNGMLASPWNRRDYVHSPVSVSSPRVCNVSRVTFSIGGGTSPTTNFTQKTSYMGVLLINETGTVVKQQECEHDDERFVRYEWTGLSGCYHMELRDGKTGAWSHIMLNFANFYQELTPHSTSITRGPIPTLASTTSTAGAWPTLGDHGSLAALAGGVLCCCCLCWFLIYNRKHCSFIYKRWPCRVNSTDDDNDVETGPDDLLSRGVSVAYILGDFSQDVLTAAGDANPNFHTITKNFFYGERAKGYGKICPRDRRPHCAFVDALDSPFAMAATVFLSWTWSYKLKTFIGAMTQWTLNKNLAPESQFIWYCAFCSNQFRILDEKCSGGADNLETVFKERLQHIGRMIVMLDTWDNPQYYTRLWCIYEQFVAAEVDIPVEVVMAHDAEQDFKRVLSQGSQGMIKLSDSLRTIDSEKATASMPSDITKIKTIISSGSGFKYVDARVAGSLKAWCTKAFANSLDDQWHA